MSKVKVFARFRPLNEREEKISDREGRPKFLYRPDPKRTHTLQIPRPKRREASRSPGRPTPKSRKLARRASMPAIRSPLTAPPPPGLQKRNSVGSMAPTLEDAQYSLRSFTFDGIMETQTTQHELYETCAQPLVDDVFTGFNGCVMAYGQTGSGKTHSMMGQLGDPESEGVIPRLLTEVFRRADQVPKDTLVTVQCSYVEIYMEHVQDLLSSSAETHSLRLRESFPNQHEGQTTREGGGTVYIENCTVETVESAEQAMQVLHKGSKHRTVASTEMNQRSSRSHAVFILHVVQTHLVQQTRKSSKLFLVDLAGSERVDRSGVSGLQLDQAITINVSLSALCDVIQALTKKGKPGHIPYRNSKLTYLLKDALGGNSKTVLLLALSPAWDSHRETYSTLEFGKRAKLIKNPARINQDLSLDSYKNIAEALEAELKELKELHECEQEIWSKEKDFLHTQCETLTEEARQHADNEEEMNRLKEQLAMTQAENESLVQENKMLREHDDRMIAEAAEHRMRVAQLVILQTQHAALQAEYEAQQELIGDMETEHNTMAESLKQMRASWDAERSRNMDLREKKERREEDRLREQNMPTIIEVDEEDENKIEKYAQAEEEEVKFTVSSLKREEAEELRKTLRSLHDDDDDDQVVEEENQEEKDAAKNLPQAAKDLPQAAKDLPQTAKDLPQAAKDLPQAAKVAPDYSIDKVEEDNDLYLSPDEDDQSQRDLQSPDFSLKQQHHQPCSATCAAEISMLQLPHMVVLGSALYRFERF